MLAKDGTIAAWVCTMDNLIFLILPFTRSKLLQGYSEFRLPRYPEATKLIHEYSQGTNPEKSLGPHWERPGRTILDEHLKDVPDPESVVPGKFTDFERIYFAGTYQRKSGSASLLLVSR